MLNSIGSEVDSGVMAENIYENRAVAFLDILGFSDVIMRGGSETEISQLFGALKKRAEEVDGLSLSGRMQLSVFSDSIVVSEEYLGGFGAERIAGYATYLATEILARGFLVRGGVCVGPLYHRDGTVFGPALIEAYNMESRTAIYPRIIVSESFVDACVLSAWEQRGGLNKEIGVPYALSKFRTDFDGVRHLEIFANGPYSHEFLELGGFVVPSPGEGAIITPQVVADAARNAVAKTRRLRCNSAVNQKYDWMDNYLTSTANIHHWPPQKTMLSE